MIQRRALAAGIDTAIGCHNFRATGITEYLKNGGKLEIAQQMANYELARTTGLYDRRNDQVSLDEVERDLIYRLQATLLRIEDRMLRRSLDQRDRVLTVGSPNIALAAPSDLLAVRSIVDPVPLSFVVLLLPVTRISHSSHASCPR